MLKEGTGFETGSSTGSIRETYAIFSLLNPRLNAGLLVFFSSSTTTFCSTAGTSCAFYFSLSSIIYLANPPPSVSRPPSFGIVNFLIGIAGA